MWMIQSHGLEFQQNKKEVSWIPWLILSASHHSWTRTYHPGFLHMIDCTLKLWDQTSHDTASCQLFDHRNKTIVAQIALPVQGTGRRNYAHACGYLTLMPSLAGKEAAQSHDWTAEKESQKFFTGARDVPHNKPTDFFIGICIFIKIETRAWYIAHSVKCLPCSMRTWV